MAIHLLLVLVDRRVLVLLCLHHDHQSQLFHHDQLVQLAQVDLEVQDLLAFLHHQLGLQSLGFLVHQLVRLLQVGQVGLLLQAVQEIHCFLGDPVTRLNME